MLTKRAFLASLAAIPTVGVFGTTHAAHVDKIPVEGVKFSGVGSKSVSGTVRFKVLGDDVIVTLGKDFKTDKGPDLFLLLHKSAKPTSYREGEFVNLGKLQRFNGEQGFIWGGDGPSTKLGDYKSVVVWCREFNVTFGVATFQK